MGLAPLARSEAGGLEELVLECERLMREPGEPELELLELRHSYMEEVVLCSVRAATLGFFALQRLERTLTSIRGGPAAYIEEVSGVERVC